MLYAWGIGGNMLAVRVRLKRIAASHRNDVGQQFAEPDYCLI